MCCLVDWIVDILKPLLNDNDSNLIITSKILAVKLYFLMTHCQTNACIHFQFVAAFYYVFQNVFLYFDKNMKNIE